MDLPTALVCAGVIAVSAAVVYLTSVLGIKEKTYEEAIEEQRRRSNNLNELIGKSGKAEKVKKEKKDKSKKMSKKLKEKIVVSEESTDGNTSAGASTSHHKDQHQKITVVKPRDESVNRKHVELKAEPQVIVVNEREAAGTEKRSKSSFNSSEKPPKPILLNKDEVVTPHHIDIPSTNRQRNSFDLIHPKDEFELKAFELKKFKEEAQSRNEIEEEEEEKLYGGSGNEDVRDEEEEIQRELDSLEVIVKGDVRSERSSDSGHEMSTQRKPKKPKHSQRNGNIGNSGDLTSKQIIDFCKCAPLTNEEIQLLTDILLNKQNDGSTEWTKKNDPIAMLKKQLQEKEQSLDAEMKNLQAAHQKTRELRQELANERAKQSTNRDKADHFQQEVQLLRANALAAYEQHKAEMKQLTNQMQQIQSKMAEERSMSMQLQDENARLSQRIQQIQSDQHLKREVEELRAERQQFDRRVAALTQSNDELCRKVQQYDNHLKSLNDARQKDELAFQQRFNDVSKDLQKSETQRTAMLEELKQSQNRAINVENEKKDIKCRLEEIESVKTNEIKLLTSQLNDLTREKVQLECSLKETQSQMQNGGEIASLDNKQRIEKLQDELSSSKEENKNLKNELDNQKQKNDELREKNWKAVEAIKLAEEQGKERLQSSLKDAQSSFDQKLDSELSSLATERDSTKSKLSEVTAEKEKLYQEKQHLKQVLTQVLPRLSSYGEDWTQHVENMCGELTSSNDQDSLQQTNSKVLEELESCLKIEREKNAKLEAEALQYRNTLGNTEGVLSDLQSKAETQEEKWNLVKKEYEERISELTNEKNKLSQEKSQLEVSLSEIEGLRTNIAEMESTLKELHAKLKGGEIEKKQWEAKFDEVSTRTNKVSKTYSDLREEMNEKNREFETFEKDKSEIDMIKLECETLREQLEKEKKTSKDLSNKNVKLNSLVKIGQDSLKMEEDKVNQLQALLNLKNGSVNSNVNVNNCPTSNNGSSLDQSNPLTSPGDSSDEGVLAKK